MVSQAPVPDDVARKLAKLLHRAKELEQVEKARENFLDFVKFVWPNFIPGRHHEIMAQKFEAIARGEQKRLIINLPPRHPLHVDTPVLTTAGWKTMETVEVGDFVFGPDGQPTEVLGKSPIYEDCEIYEVTTDDGAVIRCDGDHRWKVSLDRKDRSFRIYTAHELWLRECGDSVRYLRSGSKILSKGRGPRPSVRAPKLPATRPVSLPHADLPIDPYVLGVWLGDGTSRQGVITMRDEDAAIVRAEFERRGYQTTDQATQMTFGVRGLKVRLRQLGLLREGGVGGKFVPEVYKTASPEQRRDLVRGLMDTDGNVAKHGQCLFSQKDRALIDSFRELLWSLGIKNTLQVSRAKLRGVDYGETYRVSFYMKNPCLLPRKSERSFASPKGRFMRVRKTEDRGRTVCIKVARPDEMFLVGREMVPTMNTKSEFASYLFPAWFIGRMSDRKIMQATHTADLSIRFGRKIKNLMESEEYKKIFPDSRLRSDSKAAYRWETDEGGEYYACGVGGNIAGRGADLFIVDDPHSEQDAQSPSALENAWEWYQSGPRQRLQPGGAIVVVMTRWGETDLTARLIKQQGLDPKADQWEVIELPAILPSGDPLWPQYWKLEELEKVKASISLSKWQAQYMQQPTADSVSIVKRDWWRKWERTEIPRLHYVMQSYDTAFLKTRTADFSAIQTWGVFYPVEDGPANVILLDAKKGRWEFPDLKRIAFSEYEYWEPETVLVESKAAGLPLTQELRSMGIPVVNYSPSRGNDKFSRLNSVAPLFEAGLVWCPETSWAEEVIEEIAAFPNGEHDDHADCAAQALMRFRQGGFITHPEDYVLERTEHVGRRVYY